jgi:ubiquinone biosynthesis protein UbiJ
MKPTEEIAQLKQENAKLQEQVDSLQKRLAEMEAAKPKSKSRQ